EAHLARLMQVYVQPDAMSFRDAEYAVELAFGVAIDFQRIDAADHIGAVANRRIEQIENARAPHDTALPESNDLHRDPVGIARARGLHPLQLRAAAFDIDIDMGAQMRRAACDALADQVAGTSVSIRLMRVGPAAWPIHGSPVSVLSRCMWPSTSPGNTR